MNDDKPIADPARLDEELVAYLDGELDARSACRIEAMLAADSEVRRRLQQLSRTWEALDELAPATVDERFTHTTLEMVAAAAERDHEREQAEAPRRGRRARWLSAAGLAAAGMAGFLSVALFWPDPNQALRRDLGVLDNLEPYRQIREMTFLERLAHANLFAEEKSLETPSSAASPPSRIEDRTPEAKAELARQQERFLALDPAEQNRFRALHRRISRDANRAELQAVMRRYYEWVKALPPYTRAELLELAPESRFRRVEEIRAAELREAARRLAPQEAEAVLQWVEAYVRRLAKQLPEEDQKRLREAPLPLRRNELLQRFIYHLKASGAKPGRVIAPEDLADLKSKLSPVHQKELDGKSPAEQHRLIGSWIRGALHQRFFSHRPGKTPVDEEELTRFFEEDLTPRERDYLLGLPGEQMRAELGRIYRDKTTPGGRRPKRPFRRDPGKFDDFPPGPPGNPPRPRPPGPDEPPRDRPYGVGEKPSFGDSRRAGER